MGRKKKLYRHQEHECRVCQVRFEAVRDDARYCSPRCRKTISRAMRAAAVVVKLVKSMNGRPIGSIEQEVGRKLATMADRRKAPRS